MALMDILLDLLLDSPIPPPRWLPRKDWRHRQARAIIARRFSDHPHPPLVSSHYLADFGSAHPLFGGSRIVAASEIQAELEIELSQLNPPIFQGWLIGVALICGAVFLGAFAALGFQKAGASAGDAPAALLLAPAVLLAATLIGGFFECEVELQANTVAIRRWTQVWFRRPGIHLAHRVGIRATLVGPSGLQLESGDQAVSVSMAFWPPTVRAEVKATLHGWGVELEGG